MGQLYTSEKITGHELRHQLGLAHDAMRKRIQRKLGLSMSDLLDANQVAIVSDDKGVQKPGTKTHTGKPRTIKQPNLSPKPPAAAVAKNATAAPGPKLTTAGAFRWTMIGVCGAHSILVANGLETLFPNGEGLIAGGLACLVIAGCLIVAHAPELPRTSQNAAWLATVLYAGAWFVHFRAFKVDNPAADPVFVGCLAAFICLMAMWSVWLVRDSKIIE